MEIDRTVTNFNFIIIPFRRFLRVMDQSTEKEYIKLKPTGNASVKV